VTVIEECPSRSCTTLAGSSRPPSVSRLIHHEAKKCRSATLGVQSYRDEIYAEVAKGNLERSAIATLGFLDALPIAVFSVLFLAVIFRKKVKSVRDKLVAEAKVASSADRIPRSLTLWLVFLLSLAASSKCRLCGPSTLFARPIIWINFSELLPHT
jgi:hypothetical protein